MDPNQLGGELFSLTGALEPSGKATAVDLQKARTALGATLNAGIAAETRPPEISAALGRVGSTQFTQLDQATQQQFSGVQTAEASPGFVSNSPIISAFSPSTPAWARGMAIEAVGPFEEQITSVLSWVQILIPLPRKVNVKYGNQVVAVITLSGAPVAGKTSLPLGAGSVWIAAQLLASACPASSWTGFLVKGGTLTLGQYQLTNGEIIIGASARFTLQADLAQPAPPAPVTGSGIDGSAVTATLPASITIAFTSSSATITALGNINATIYGSALSIKKNAQAPAYNANLAGLFVPGDVGGGTQFTFKSVNSTLFKPSGTTPIVAAGWMLPVAVTMPDKLGQAAGTGGVALALGPGSNAIWTGLSAPLSIAGAVIVASPGQLLIWTVLPATPFSQSWNLWNGTLRPSTIEFIYSKSGSLFFLSTAAPSPGEELLVGGSTIAHADRPVEAMGLRVAATMPVALLAIIQTSAIPTGLLLIEGAAPLSPTAEPAAFALENALIEALPPQLLVAGGTLDASVTGNNIAKGVLLFQFGLTAFLPTLPDPYATGTGLIGNSPPSQTGPNHPPPEPIGVLRSVVTWTTPTTPLLEFLLSFSQSSTGTTTLVPTGSLATRQGTGLNLLDVSSNADQFGVNWAPQGLNGVRSQGLVLIGEGAATSLFTVSAISWEQMLSPSPIPAAPSDGVASKLNVPTVALAPIAPIPLMTAQQSRVAKGDPYSFTGTLPFGMIAEVTSAKGATYDFVRPKFDGYNGGHQISMIPAGAQNTKAEFPGQTILADPYGTAVLSSDIATIFRADFTIQPGSAEAGVPVRRYDLSGYGASVFSDWSDPNVLGTGILKVQFKVWVGRTAYEVVQAQSIIYPWGIKIVRTITIERISGGDVTRQDSGWQAATAGQFNFPTKTAGEFNGAVHAGPVDGVFNVRNIRDNGSQFILDGITYVPVLFDADVQINKNNPVVSGASQSVYVPSQNITGWAQLAPDDSPATRANLADLLSQKGAAVGPIACTINIGAAGQQMKVSSAEVSVAGSGETAAFVASLNGTPVLSRDGQWSMAVKTGSQTPAALDPQTAVPLIQPNGQSVWYLANPSDILNLASPATQYGYLQGTSTQKTFFGRPQIPQGANKVSIPDPPRVADVGSLLGASGIFPDLAKALAFPNPQDLVLGALGSDTLTLNNLPPFPVNQPPLTLLDFGPVSAVLVYADRSQPSAPATTVTFNLNPGGNPSWSITFEKFTFVLVSPFGDVNNPLLQVVGSAHADSNTAPTLGKLTVLYGSILSIVEEVFSKLNELASFLPGGGESSLAVSFSDGQLTIRDKFALPTLPLGLGDITNVALDLGATMQFAPMSMDFTAGIASPDDPFHWLVSPLSGTGCVQVGFNNGDANLLIQAGIGVGLAIDVGIAEGSASIVLAFQVDNTVSPFEVKVILTGQASVDVLGGLASASLMLSAALTIIPALPDITLIGSVAVGIHISICWVVSIDFDGSWQFSQTLTA